MRRAERFLQAQRTGRPPRGSVALVWLGQAGFAFVSSGGTRIWIDPYLSDACERYSGNKRMMPPPVTPQQVETDAVLVTHEHRDHLDVDAVAGIAAANPHAVFAGPPTCTQIMGQLGVPRQALRPMARGDDMKIGDVTVRAVNAHHTADSVGYVLSLGTVRVYVSGDTRYEPDLASTAQLHHPHLAFICANGRLGNMDIHHAARLSHELGVELAVPMHYGMFAANTIDPDRFVAALTDLPTGPRAMVLPPAVWHHFAPGRPCRPAPDPAAGRSDADGDDR